jgi:biopolymer transport protein TolR
MGMSGGSAGGTMADINVTPLVDVMLVLLIIFMITAPMMNNAGVEIDLPKAEAPPLNMDDEEQLVLSMQEDGLVLMNDLDTPFTLEELPDRLRAIADANPDRAVFLRADGDLLQPRRKRGLANFLIVDEQTSLLVDRQLHRLLILVERLGAAVGQVDRHARGEQRRGDHEDDKQHQHHVDERRDVDVRHRGSPPASSARGQVHRHVDTSRSSPSAPGKD